MNDRYGQQSFQSRRRENGDFEDHWFDDAGLGIEEPNGGSRRGDQNRRGQGYGSGPASSYRPSGLGGGEASYGFGGPHFRGQGDPIGYGQNEFGPGNQGGYAQSGFGPDSQVGYGGPGGYGQGVHGQISQSRYGSHSGCGQGGFGRDEFRQSSQQRGFGQSQSGYGFGQPSPGQETGYGAMHSRSSYGQQWTQGGFGSSEQSKRYCNCGPKGYERSDERIKEDVNDCLSDGSIDAREITVNVHDGEVTLTGSVESRQMKFQAESMAEHCSGVKDVINQLRVISAFTSPQVPARSSSPMREDTDDMKGSQKSKSSALAGSRG